MSGEKKRNFTAEIKEAARNIWLAGLGAVLTRTCNIDTTCNDVSR